MLKEYHEILNTAISRKKDALDTLLVSPDILLNGFSPVFDGGNISQKSLK